MLKNKQMYEVAGEGHTVIILSVEVAVQSFFSLIDNDHISSWLSSQPSSMFLSCS